MARQRPVHRRHAGPCLGFSLWDRAQGTGSLGPHILARRHTQVLSDLAGLRDHSCLWVQASRLYATPLLRLRRDAPRVVGDLSLGKPVLISSVAQQHCKFDGGSELPLLRDGEIFMQEQKQLLDAATEPVAQALLASQACSSSCRV